MKSSSEEFSTLSQGDKINLISKETPQLLGMLKKDLTSLNAQELDTLHEVSILEITAQNMSQQSSQIAPDFSESIKEKLDELKLTEEEKVEVDNIYKQTILVSMQKAKENISHKLEKSKDTIHSFILSEKAVDIMDGILNFKKKIDKRFPGLSDKIIAAAVPVIITAITNYLPPVGLALKSSGLLDRAVEFLKTENLEKTIDKMRANLVEINKDKQLAEIQETAVKISKLAEELEVSPNSLSKLGLSLKGVVEITKEITNDGASKKLLQDVCKYAEKHLPNSEKQVDDNFEAIKEVTLKNLKSYGASTDTLKEVSTILDNAIVQAKDEMQNALKPDSKIFDKITSVQQSADIMDKVASKVTAIIVKNNPENAQLKEESSKIITKETNKIIRGDVTKVARHLTSNSTAKKFAQETLGAGLANEMVLKRSLPDKQVGRSMSR
jgi:hypothetical protein